MPKAPPPEDSVPESSHPRDEPSVASPTGRSPWRRSERRRPTRSRPPRRRATCHRISPSSLRPAPWRWDGFARETQQAMRVDRLANNAQVVNIPGAGGTIGLGKFSTMHGQADTILATGTAMVGGIALNKSPVGFDNTTLLARVAEDYDVLIAAADSPHNTIDDVVGAWKKDPKGFVWTGGSAGSVDHLTIAQLALLGKISASDITYIPKSGGGEAIKLCSRAPPTSPPAASTRSPTRSRPDASKQSAWPPRSGSRASTRCRPCPNRATR